MTRWNRLEPWIAAARQAAKLLTGAARRALQAQYTNEYAQGNPRLAESLFGWNRQAVRRGLQEIERTYRHPDKIETRGRMRLESIEPRFLSLAQEHLSDQTQADPELRSAKLYTRITGLSLRQMLAADLEVTVESLPVDRTFRRILQRNGYALKRVRKTLPHKKIPQTDAIFANVHRAHERARHDASILRISIDCKARVKIGDFSRSGLTRDHQEQEAADHDMGGKFVTPSGILEIESGQLSVALICSSCTSHAIVDHLERWWALRQTNYAHVRTLMIDLDNGPEVSSRRTQFMHRMVEFSQRAGLSIELVYYPPYHSKYNRIERCWGVLEQHWNGTQLKTIEIAMRWLATMTWKGIQPIVEVTIKGYEKGVRLTREAFQRVESRQGARIWVTLSSDEARRSCKVQLARLPLLAKLRRSPG